ncbi:NUDIX hydrolase domain-containing protein [Gottschalkia acidurici 9a]|uniref:NUDIX hydrolase domain-containing protein n=1 Tax=Gottschalkia acidurici (strain ATCC 7906 / DSM 604 / BCRC 14475 / CIP 104303 / KCTC 5404 / NCIMB 10678 / 9a) TaxID=1128398 RepID=K0AZ27_GOTA9|nr:NUDIX domain-containing protein [Gottschalkia acidurici]AFS79053.1 NUDIX hydrolase domain-containing protein [Gottschalkia acidurici 9a]
MKDIDNIHPGVAIIIFDKNKKVLLQKRADVELWGIPSGHVEIGESVMEAAIREVKEETGLSICITRLIGIYSDPKSQVFEYPNGTTTHFITTYFEGEVIEGEINCSSDETLELCYFGIEALPENILPMHPQWLKDALCQQDRAFIR